VPTRIGERVPEVEPLDAHNRALVANVHPTDWVTPSPKGRYNLVVLGAGTAGLVARVALIETHLMGGDGLNVGCVPSKALLRSARAAADARDSGRFGVRVPEGTTVDFPGVMDRMRRLRAGISPHDSASRFRDLCVNASIPLGRTAPARVVHWRWNGS